MSSPRRPGSNRGLLGNWRVRDGAPTPGFTGGGLLEWCGARDTLQHRPIRRGGGSAARHRVPLAGGWGAWGCGVSLPRAGSVSRAGWATEHSLRVAVTCRFLFVVLLWHQQSHFVSFLHRLTDEAEPLTRYGRRRGGPSEAAEGSAAGNRLKGGGGTPLPLPTALTLPKRHSHTPTPAPTAFPTARNRSPHLLSHPP